VLAQMLDNGDVSGWMLAGVGGVESSRVVYGVVTANVTGVTLGSEVECRCRYRAAESGLIANT